MTRSPLSFCLAAVVLLGTDALLGQEPFSMPMVDHQKVRVISYKNILSGEESSATPPRGIGGNFSMFSQGALGILADGSDFGGSVTPSVNLNIIQYRLGLCSYVKTQKGSQGTSEAETIRVYLPLMFLSKLSAIYDSTRLTTFSDITSFDGAPFTIRLMPAYTWQLGLENTLSVGHVSDLRALVYSEGAGDGLKTSFGYYFSLGVKYAGRGDVRDESGLSYQGTWSVSLLASAFFTNSTTKALLLNNPEDLLGACELLFKFIASEAKFTRLNVYVSLQRQWARTKLSSPWMIKFTLGS